MDIGNIMAAMTSLKSATDIAKMLIELKSISEVQAISIKLREQIISAQSAILIAQSEQAAMIQKISDLEEKISKMKNWEKEKQRYELVSPWNGCVTYALKESSCKGTEPPHYICSNCYEDGRKSILNQHRKPSAFIEFVCPFCGATIQPPGRYSKGFSIEFAEKYL